MQTNHHLMGRVHNEAVAAGHWCSMHILHDRHVWIGLMIALAVVVLIALLVAMAMTGVPANYDLNYSAYPYGMT